MIGRRRTMVFYLVVGVILGSGLVSLSSFAPFDQPLYISNSEAGPPSQSLTSPTHLIESESTATGAISADTLQGHSQATASTPSEQPAPTLVFTHQVAGPIQAPVLVAHNPTHVRTGPGVGYALLTRLPAEQMAFVVGRNADGTWLAIPTAGGETGSNGWVSAALVTIEGDADGVPIISTSPPVPALRYR